MTTIGELGEDAVLARILSRFDTSGAGGGASVVPGATVEIGPGDDAAVVAIDGRTVLTTDTMVEGPDFRRDWSTAGEVGAKAVASNLADLAAMGADPVGLLIALSAPAATDADWMVGFAGGVAAALASLAPGAGVLGGDLASGAVLVVAVTAVGVLPPGRRAVTRSGARAGDLVAVAGELGLAGAGLAVLRSLGAQQARAAHPVLVAAHLAPAPPIALGPSASGATAMLDVSDGLARDALRIADASGVAIVFDPDAIAGEAAELASLLPGDLAPEAERFVLEGGEDHALLACFPDAPPPGFRVLGRVSSGRGVHIGGRPLQPSGWDSLAG